MTAKFTLLYTLEGRILYQNSHGESMENPAGKILQNVKIVELLSQGGQLRG
jgi:hypothetical protein